LPFDKKQIAYPNSNHAMLQRSKSVKDLPTYLKIIEHICNRHDVITEEDLQRIRTDLPNKAEETPRSIAKGLQKKKIAK
jgi:hypothetical protein